MSETLDIGSPGEDPPFGELLLRHRRSARLTQADLAQASGVSVRALSDLERGRAKAAQRRSTEALADALGLTGDTREDFLSAARDGRRRGRPRPAGAFAGPPPPAVPDLVGRGAELDELRRAAGDARTTPSGVVVSLVGHPGVGKTALARSAAHDLAADFPDGFLSVDLRGMDDQPVSPRAALDVLLRGLNVPAAEIPASVGEQSALFRSMLAGRRVLVLLDNAADEAQVRPLLAAATGCLTLVTCRRALAGLESARWLWLRPLDTADASALVAAIAGADRVRAEPSSAEELAQLCGNLPLAVRIAGNRLATRPHWTISYLVDQLRDERTRLASLSAGDLRVRSAFEMSHRRLSPAARLVFRRLAVIPGPDFGAELATVATGMATADVRAHIAELVDANLVQEGGVPGRHTFHDLIRLFARERLEAEENPDEAWEAVSAVVDHLLDTAAGAGRLFFPDALRASVEASRFASREQAAQWLDAEAANWLAAQRIGHGCGKYRQVVDLARALHWFSDGRSQQLPWHDVFALGVASARALDSRADEAVLLNFLGWARYYCLGDNEGGRAAHQEALDIATETGDRREQTWALAYLGSVLLRLDRPEEALDHVERAVGLADMDFWMGQGSIRNVLGKVLCAVGRPGEALLVHREVLADAERYRDDANLFTRRFFRALTFQLLGRALTETGDWPGGADAFRTARKLFDEGGFPVPGAECAVQEGVAWREAGRLGVAEECLLSALDVFTQVITRWQRAQALAELVRVLDAGARTAVATACRREALEVCADLGTDAAADLAKRLVGEPGGQS
ncbi:transcriptional regulator with XRE-family HTH domain/tetratricopeptide (TPR) repeat protein [Amycolatopsis endophytica]|uniref:Transcriptional regulator with XRE-family HTH domain/tetratricopeptide (TPR) repeat protein n=1 Tax=Amycolatopsis endophytica TaxID=860233 RepID=A0A853BDF5_9PSEU|nr:tetratricopeptide repeat protein [Amycolatopsis endophytica]NYI93403.1 transcriptional regulator with XRE-family HTH domain/tetratricopeptide (TPR) repeat protein [Amycolatopsis endophytica]